MLLHNAEKLLRNMKRIKVQIHHKEDYGSKGTKDKVSHRKKTKILSR